MFLNFFSENTILFLENVFALDTHPDILNPEDKCDNQQLGGYINQITDTLKLISFEFKNICIYTVWNTKFLFIL